MWANPKRFGSKAFAAKAFASKRFGAPAPAAGTWSEDAESGKGVPADATEWNAALADAGMSTSFAPSGLWLCQDASGSIAAAIGSEVLTAFGAVRYARDITGWTRNAIGFDEDTNGEFYNTSLGDTTTASRMLIGYIGSLVSTNDHGLMQLGGGSGARWLIRVDETGDPPYIAGNGGQGLLAGAGDHGGLHDVHPYVFQVNRTAGRFAVYTDVEKVEGTGAGYTVPAGGSAYLNIGSNLGVGTTPDMMCCYLAYFTGAAAEMTKAQIKALLQTLGWTIPWS